MLCAAVCETPVLIDSCADLIGMMGEGCITVNKCEVAPNVHITILRFRRLQNQINA